MAWAKVKEPRNNTVTIKYSDKEMIQIRLLMKRDCISKQAAARILSFPKEGADGVLSE